jgi:hypothetical protein
MIISMGRGSSTQASARSGMMYTRRSSNARLSEAVDQVDHAAAAMDEASKAAAEMTDAVKNVAGNVRASQDEAVPVFERQQQMVDQIAPAVYELLREDQEMDHPWPTFKHDGQTWFVSPGRGTWRATPITRGSRFAANREQC